MKIEAYIESIAVKTNRTKEEISFIASGLLVIVIIMTIWFNLSYEPRSVSRDQEREMREIDQAMEQYFLNNPDEL